VLPKPRKAQSPAALRRRAWSATRSRRRVCRTEALELGTAPHMLTQSEAIQFSSTSLRFQIPLRCGFNVAESVATRLCQYLDDDLMIDQGTENVVDSLADAGDSFMPAVYTNFQPVLVEMHRP
jgi:hypothetical protein